MIRVLHMIGSLNVGGSQTLVMNLYRNIDRNKIQFDFILDHSNQIYFLEEVKQLGGRIFFLPEFKGKNIFEVTASWRKFFEEHREYKILHSHVRSYASLYIPIAKKFGLKTIIHSHSTSNGSGIKSYIKSVMQYLLRFQADYFFSCSKESGRWLFGKSIVESNRYFIIKNAIDTSIYEFNESLRSKYRNEIMVDFETTVFMHVGRLHEAKNHKFLIEVFYKYNCLHPNSVLVIVGDGDLRSEIEEQIHSLNIEKNVRMLGLREDVQNLLQAADCFLFPSNWEGLPVTVIEAQASGLVSFVSDRVTNDVNVSKLVRYISIENGIEPWVCAIENTDLKRSNVKDQIIDSGFDVKSVVNWLTDFYMGIIEQ